MKRKIQNPMWSLWESGLLSVVTILSALLQPAAAFVIETEPVTAEDYEVEAGSSFDVTQEVGEAAFPDLETGFGGVGDLTDQFMPPTPFRA